MNVSTPPREDALDLQTTLTEEERQRHEIQALHQALKTKLEAIEKALTGYLSEKNQVRWQRQMQSYLKFIASMKEMQEKLLNTPSILNDIG